MENSQDQPIDANSRLKARMRATVPPRDTTLFKKQENSEATLEPESISSKAVETIQQINNATKQQNNKAVSQQLNNTVAAQKLVSFTLRIEDSIDRDLKALCSNESITKETFLEAAYLVCRNNEQMLKQVLKISKERRKERRETGVQRRARAMTKYLD